MDSLIIEFIYIKELQKKKKKKKKKIFFFFFLNVLKKIE